MEKWQYMAVMAIVDPRGVQKLVELDTSGYQREMGQDSTLAATLTSLNRLGEQGWEVINVDEQLGDGGWRTSTYLLKQPASQ